jgi:hypothetical protein
MLTSLTSVASAINVSPPTTHSEADVKLVMLRVGAVVLEPELEPMMVIGMSTTSGKVCITASSEGADKRMHGGRDDGLALRRGRLAPVLLPAALRGEGQAKPIRRSPSSFSCLSKASASAIVGTS